MEFERIIDYIIEQANKYDIHNEQFEKDILSRISSIISKYYEYRIPSLSVAIDSVLGMTKLISRIEEQFTKCNYDIKLVLKDKFKQHYKSAYNNTEDLIELGKELDDKFNTNIEEMRYSNKEYDANTIEFIQEYAFELMKGHSQQKVEQLRSSLGDLFLRGRANKANVRSVIEKSLEVSRSKAEEIAQTELSRAYSYGTLQRLTEYKEISHEQVWVYWHGFKHSKKTCNYCEPRIGSTYLLDEMSEELPAHPRCRCVWLPLLEGWNSPIDRKLISRANMINTAYNRDMLVQRINNRLNINYADFLDTDIMQDYINGERTSNINSELDKARDEYIKDLRSNFDIAKENANTHMGTEFNTQLTFWENYIAKSVADNDTEALKNVESGIQGTMLLPWSGEQINKFNSLIRIVSSLKY